MPPAPETHAAPVEAFIERWQKAEAAERANDQMSLAELCDLIKASHPDPAGADNELNRYIFDRAITRQKPDGSATNPKSFKRLTKSERLFTHCHSLLRSK